ncbi:MAG: glycosyltransferase family 2 protein [Acutalibacteraceae bacterium]
MLISVVIPVYNSQKTVSRCIKSVLNQTQNNLEIIAVNDGSSDKSGEILDKLAESDDRIKVIHQENQGSVAARRNGVNCSSGDYVCFIDSDDIMSANAIELLFKQAQKSNSDICTGATIRRIKSISVNTYTPPCLSISEPQTYEREQILNELYLSWFGISNVPVSLCAKLFKSEIIKEAYSKVRDMKIFFGDDLIVTLNAFSIAERVSFIPDIVYYYYVGGGTSKFRQDMLDEWIKLYNYKMPFAEKYIPDSDAFRLADIELCNMTFTYFEMLIEKGGYSYEQFEQSVKSALARPEIQKACNNKKCANSANAVLLKNADVKEIYQTIVKTVKKNKLKNLIKKIIG